MPNANEAIIESKVKVDRLTGWTKEHRSTWTRRRKSRRRRSSGATGNGWKANDGQMTAVEPAASQHEGLHEPWNPSRKEMAMEPAQRISNLTTGAIAIRSSGGGRGDVRLGLANVNHDDDDDDDENHNSDATAASEQGKMYCAVPEQRRQSSTSSDPVAAASGVDGSESGAEMRANAARYDTWQPSSCSAEDGEQA
ncbi:hypothetical protein B2J93_8892 [Marssonina coronariae]|uniref:Uncharacterized protein n=1 Tax=Diplocarpon coronariae TaxID=2795749 RepID=A0A218YS36_9HELO|nr:hypothetical protein B2J93_8892 [Marssonina coronariae]